MSNSNPFPIPQDETWWILDSTKIQEFMECPRAYMFMRLFGWQPISPNLHLVYGSAHHDGMEYLLVNGIQEKSLRGAIDVFLETYYEKFTKIKSPSDEHPIPSDFMLKLLDVTDEAFSLNSYYLACLKYYQVYYKAYKDKVNRPKSPGDAILAFTHYVLNYARESTSREVLHTEVSGTVPIDDRRVLHFRIDAILKDELGIFVQEHKTLSQKDNKWIDKWYTKIQIGTYLHALHMLFLEGQVKGLEVNGMCLYKDEVLSGKSIHPKQEVVRVFVDKSKELMAAWLWNVRHWYDLLEWNMERLKEASARDDILSCFPMNTESCDKWFGCKFMPYCRLWPNPLKHCSEPPPGFQVDWWNPADREKIAKKVVHLEKEGE